MPQSIFCASAGQEDRASTATPRNAKILVYGTGKFIEFHPLPVTKDQKLWQTSSAAQTTCNLFSNDVFAVCRHGMRGNKELIGDL